MGLDMIHKQFTENLLNLKSTQFDFSFFFSYTEHGIDLYYLEHISPRILCQTDTIDDATMEVFKKDSTFDYSVTFYQPTCSKLESRFTKEEQFFKVCKIREDITIIITEEDIYEREFKSNWSAFKFGLLLGCCLVCCVACVFIG